MSITITDQLKKIIANDLDVNLKIEEIDENASLFEDGLAIDSLAIVELISLIEETFDFEFSEDDINPNNFESLKVLSTLIEQKVNRN
jgi:acyl carrier protein